MPWRCMWRPHGGGGGEARLVRRLVGRGGEGPFTAEQPLMLTSFPRYLTENKEMDLNIRDKWDSTPLYYACLCGHLELVSG